MKTHRHENRLDLPDLTACLRRKACKITGQREAILNVLRRHAHPMSSKEIFARLRKGDCNLATIYRALHLLEKVGMVKRFDFGDGAARYELMGLNDDGHHHHLVCLRCAAVVEIEECFPRELEEKIAGRNGFQSVIHKLEFFGVCPQCQ